MRALKKDYEIIYKIKLDKYLLRVIVHSLDEKRKTLPKDSWEREQVNDLLLYLIDKLDEA